MSDLTDEELTVLRSSHARAGIADTYRMVVEIDRHRAARAASAERVREVVLMACIAERDVNGSLGWGNRIADRAAKQLAGVGVGLSAEEREVVLRMRLMIPAEHLTPAQKMVIDRLLASPPAPDYRAAICAPTAPVIAARDPASLTEDEIRVARTAARADQEELIGVVHSCSDVLRYGDRMGPEVEVASRRRIRDYIASKKTVPIAAIAALLDSDMPAGELRKALAEIVGLR